MPDEPGTLKVTAPQEFALLRVLDGWRREVLAGNHTLNAKLTPGIYRVEATVPGSRVERIVTVRPGAHAELTSEDFANLAVKTVAPTQHSGGATPGQAEGAYIASRFPSTAGVSGRLVVYARTGGGEPCDATPSFWMIDATGATVADAASSAVSTPEEGWVALSVEQPPGTYALVQELPETGRRGQAIYLPEQFETLLFLPWDDVPRLERARGFMAAPGRGFADDFAGEYERTEAAFDGLARGKLVLTAQDEQMFLAAKFENPMLGLIAAYSYIARGQVDYDALSYIADNLVHLLPGSPDARLIKLFAGLRGKPIADYAGTNSSPPAFSEPPMFAAGTGLLLGYAAELEEFVPADSWLASVSLRLRTGSAWTRWSLDATSESAEDDLRTAVRRSKRENRDGGPTEFARRYALPRSIVRKAWDIEPDPIDDSEEDESKPPQPPSRLWQTPALLGIGGVIVLGVIALVTAIALAIGGGPDAALIPTRIAVLTEVPATTANIGDGSTSTVVAPGPPANIALAISPAAVDCDGKSAADVSASVTDKDGVAVADGTLVTFSVVSLGSVEPAEDKTLEGTARTLVTPLTDAVAGVSVVARAGEVESSVRIDCSIG